MNLKVSKESKDIYIHLFENNKFVNTDIYKSTSLILENINGNYKRLIFRGYNPATMRSSFFSMRFSDFFIIDFSEKDGWVPFSSIKNNPIPYYLSEEIWNNFLALIKNNLKNEKDDFVLNSNFINILEKEILKWHGTIDSWEEQHLIVVPKKEIDINKRKYTKKIKNKIEEEIKTEKIMEEILTTNDDDIIKEENLIQEDLKIKDEEINIIKEVNINDESVIKRKRGRPKGWKKNK